MASHTPKEDLEQPWCKLPLPRAAKWGSNPFAKMAADQCKVNHNSLTCTENRSVKLWFLLQSRFSCPPCPPRCKHMKIPLVLGSLELLNLLSIFAVKPDFKFLLDPCIQPCMFVVLQLHQQLWPLTQRCSAGAIAYGGHWWLPSLRTIQWSLCPQNGCLQALFAFPRARWPNSKYSIAHKTIGNVCAYQHQN